MALLIDNRQDFLTDDYEAFFEKALQQTLKHLKLDIQAEVSLLLVGNEEIRQLNREYRDKDCATDVLSFPLIELNPFNNASYLKALEQSIDPGTREVVLGDIVISVERAMEQAQEYGHSVQRELGFLMVHGLLHLLGYDHEKDEENEQAMNQLQESVLAELNLPREIQKF
jgi:probable rRNA maturation factor